MSKAEIIARLEKLTGPDREVDRAIHEATNPPLRTGLRFGHVPAYTASLDAAVALVERMRPGWVFNVESIQPDFLSEDEPRSSAGISGPVTWAKDPETGMLEPYFASAGGRASSPALALLIALFRALEANEAHHD